LQTSNHSWAFVCVVRFCFRRCVFAVLVGLYEEPERPANAVEYVKKFIGAPQQDDVAAIKAENQRLLEELNQVKTAFQELNAKIAEDGDNE